MASAYFFCSLRLSASWTKRRGSEPGVLFSPVFSSSMFSLLPGGFSPAVKDQRNFNKDRTRDKLRRSSPGLSLGVSRIRGTFRRASWRRRFLNPGRPIFPFPMCWCRSRWAPSGPSQSFRCKIFNRPSPTVRSISPTNARLCSSERKSYPAANPWHVSKQKPMGPSSPASSMISPISSRLAPTVRPAPALFSSNRVTEG